MKISNDGENRLDVDGCTIRPLLKTSEAAQILRVTHNTVRRWVSQEKIPFVKLGYAVRISQDDLEDFIRTHRKGGADVH